jgi:hypothetical protein
VFAQRALRPEEFGLGSDNFELIQQTASEFRTRLKASIRELPCNTYMAGDKFLKRLANELRFDTLEQVATSESTR